MTITCRDFGGRPPRGRAAESQRLLSLALALSSRAILDEAAEATDDATEEADGEDLGEEGADVAVEAVLLALDALELAAGAARERAGAAGAAASAAEGACCFGLTGGSLKEPDAPRPVVCTTPPSLTAPRRNLRMRGAR